MKLSNKVTNYGNKIGIDIKIEYYSYFIDKRECKNHQLLSYICGILMSNFDIIENSIDDEIPIEINLHIVKD